MIRALEKQFGLAKARRIRHLISEFETLAGIHGDARYYVLEIKECLLAGLLLAALEVSTSFLELFVRTLLIDFARVKLPSQARKKATLDKRIEKDRYRTFYQLVDELQQIRKVNKKDGVSIKKFYRSVRLPLVHGITSEFASEHQTCDLIHDVFLSSKGGPHEFEEALEKHALVEIKQIVSFIKKYSS